MPHSQTDHASFFAPRFRILHHLSEFVHSKDNWPWPSTICGGLWAPRRAAFTSACTAGNNKSFFSMIHGAYLTTCLAGRIRSRISRFTHLQFSCRLLLRYPAILLLESGYLVISSQSSHTRSIPRLLVASLVSQTIQNRRNRLILTYLC